MRDELVPLKRVAARLGVSRTTLWRLATSLQCPQPVEVRRRTYWRVSDLDGLIEALKLYQGRGAFGNQAPLR